MSLQWKSGAGTDLPNGGTKGQALVKKSDANQDVEWGDAAGNTESMELTQAEYDALTDEEKNNGTIYFITDGQGGGGGSYVLPPATADTLGGIKVGSGLNVTADGTLSAAGGSSLPVGGTTGQALVKKSDADGDAEWGTIQGNLPGGGNKGQLLAKKSNTSGDTEWILDTGKDLIQQNYPWGSHTETTTITHDNYTWDTETTLTVKDASLDSSKTGGTYYFPTKFTCASAEFSGFLATVTKPLPSTPTSGTVRLNTNNGVINIKSIAPTYSGDYAYYEVSEINNFIVTAYLRIKIYGMGSDPFSAELIPQKDAETSYLFSQMNRLMYFSWARSEKYTNHPYDTYETTQVQDYVRKVSGMVWEDMHKALGGGSEWGVAATGTIQVAINNRVGQFSVPITGLGITSGNNYAVYLTVVGGGTGDWGNSNTFIWEKSASRFAGTVSTEGYDVDRVDLNYTIIAKGFGGVGADWGVAKVGYAEVTFSNSGWSEATTVDITDLKLNSNNDYEVFTEQNGGGTLPAWGNTLTYVATKAKDNFTVGAIKTEAVTGKLYVKYIIFAKGFGGIKSILTAPNGTKYKLKVADDGTLSTEAI